jgi:hypothetical protein
MKHRPSEVDLDQYCVVQPYESSWQAPYDDNFHQIRPGVARKVYPTKMKRRVYQGAVLEPRDKRRPPHEIGKLIDSRRNNIDLKHQADDALNQIFYRAHCGDQEALSLFVRTTHTLVRWLETLTEYLPDKMRAEAKTMSSWPLNVGQRDLRRGHQELKELSLGAKSPLATKPTSRINLQNHWTKLVIQAIIACAENKRVVPALKKFAAAAKRERKAIPFSRQSKGWATFYYMHTGDVVIITDWQNKCTKLSGLINANNVNDWWHVVEACILEHWSNPDGDYGRFAALIPEAKKPTLQTDEDFKANKDYRKRNRAMARLKQAFESLVGVRCRT